MLRRLVLGLALMGCIAAPGLAQATAGAPCTVRIRPQAAADYDPSTEVLLQGRLVGRENGLLLLRLRAGIVRVDMGAWEEAVLREAGSSLAILASKRLENGRQRFVAREVHLTSGSVIIRDAQGVPRPAPPQL
jgi:hypothetical protein